MVPISNSLKDKWKENLERKRFHSSDPGNETLMHNNQGKLQK